MYDRKVFYLNRNLQRAEQAIDLILQRCNIRLNNYVSDIERESIQKAIDALIQGRTEPEGLLPLVHKRTRRNSKSNQLWNPKRPALQTLGRALRQESGRAFRRTHCLCTY